MTFTFTLEDRKETFEVTVYGAEMNLVIKDLDGKVKKEYEKLPIEILPQASEGESEPEDLEEEYDEDEFDDVPEEDLSFDFDMFTNPENMRVEQGMADLCDSIKCKALLKRIKPVCGKRVKDVEGIGMHFFNAGTEENFDVALSEFKAAMIGTRDVCDGILTDLGGESPVIARGLNVFFGGFGKRHD